MLAVVFERDMTVNPEPNKAFAKQLGFEVVEIRETVVTLGPILSVTSSR